jgi:hypothetical protein
MRVTLATLRRTSRDSPSIPGPGRGCSAHAGRAVIQAARQGGDGRRRMRRGVVRAVAQPVLDQADIAVLSAH